MSDRPELGHVLLQHQQRYPRMELPDAVKLVFQNEFAGGHMIADGQASLRRLRTEAAAVAVAGPDQPAAGMFEDIGNQLCRLHLRALAGSGADLATVNRFFVNTAAARHGEIVRFEEKLQLLRTGCAQGFLPFPPAMLEAYLTDYRERGYPPVSHSDAYRAAYRPAYRVVDAVYATFFPLFCRIDCLLAQGGTVNLAIDGHSSAGKSTLASLLADSYDCNVFHMDDFFLPPALKTPERLAEAGGNVDYLRFRQEVLAGLGSGREFAYRPYDCRLGAQTAPIQVVPKRLNIVEGSYSLHPTLRDSYQLKVFLAVHPEEQLRRIRLRNGEAMLERFRQEWIPLENRYFAETDVAGQCDLAFHR